MRDNNLCFKGRGGGGYSSQTHFFYYRDIIYNLYQDMCTYSQQKKIMCNPLGGQYHCSQFLRCVSQNCTCLAEYISQTVLKVEA